MARISPKSLLKHLIITIIIIIYNVIFSVLIILAYINNLTSKHLVVFITLPVISQIVSFSSIPQNVIVKKTPQNKIQKKTTQGLQKENTLAETMTSRQQTFEFTFTFTLVFCIFIKTININHIQNKIKSNVAFFACHFRSPCSIVLLLFFDAFSAERC